MTRRSLERRLAALESARTPDAGMYWVDIGEPDVDDGERVQLDEWPQRYAGAFAIDIGGEPESGADVVQK
jgi:hypothetical protein